MWCTSETKLDESFPARKFLINGYTLPYRLDRNDILLYVREVIPSKIIPVHFLNKESFS